MTDLEDGEETTMQGSGAKPYVLKNTGGVYSCSCPAWRNQSTPIERRTCKHLRKLRGEDAEKERLGGELPVRAASSGSKKDGPPILLAQAWDNFTDLTDWWISEKLDGVRAYWDGKMFLSRQGNQYMAPEWFTEGLPDEPLDGELWMDRKAFQKTVSIVRRQDQSDHWKQIKYVVFDAPEHGEGFEKRVEHLKGLIAAADREHLSALEQIPCKGEAHLQEELTRVEDLGGEGLMLRQPESGYQVGRSHSLLKVKTFHDAEAVVIGHQAGKGKHKGRLGALNVRLPDGTEFSVGTGFSDKQREHPPGEGSVITFRYQELSDGGVPRFPSFVGATDGEKAAAVSQATATPAQPATPKPAATPAAAPSGDSLRYFEFEDEKSSKFWEIGLSGAVVTVRYGRIGTDGTSKPKELADATKAQAHYDKLIKQKTAKGYQEH